MGSELKQSAQGEAISMDCRDYTTSLPKHKKGAHLTQEEQMAIRVLQALKYSIHAIARMLGCSPGAVLNELRRGTPPRKSNRGSPRIL